MGNRELDVIVENEPFAAGCRRCISPTSTNTTEVVLDLRNRVRAPGAPKADEPREHGRGSNGRVVAGAVRVGNTVTAAITNRRVLESVEAKLRDRRTLVGRSRGAGV